MITGDIKNQIDRIWDSFWSGGISNPLDRFRDEVRRCAGCGECL
jgi:hypothetical protein